MARLSWKQRKSASADALARLRQDENAELIEAVRKTHTDRLNSHDPDVRSEAEQFIKAYERKDLEALVRGVNLQTRKAVYGGHPSWKFRSLVYFTWAAPVPLGWLWTENHFMHRPESCGGEKSKNHRNAFLVTQTVPDLCCGMLIELGDYFEYNDNMHWSIVFRTPEEDRPEFKINDAERLVLANWMNWLMDDEVQP